MTKQQESKLIYKIF